MIGEAKLCDCCGEPATVSRRSRLIGRGGKMLRDDAEMLCERCAVKHGYRDEGRIEAALEAIGFAVEMMRGLGVTDSMIRDSFDGLLRGDGESTSEYEIVYPAFIGGDYAVRSGRSELPWDCETVA
jgi:hypothetical protein